MKYWFFDGSDVVGPFTPQELAAREGFSAVGSLVCPENFSEDGDSWKIAASFPDFQPDGAASGFSSSSKEAPLKTEAAPAAVSARAADPADSTAFDKEMDTLLKNPSLLGDAQEPAPDGPSLELPKKPAKPGPIEDYFNNINGEDLGDILGIPDPNEISDMNLARALQDQFEKTSPPSDKEIDSSESDDPEAERRETAPDENKPEANASADAPVNAAQRPAGAEPATTSESAGSVPISVSAQEEPFIVLPGEQTAAAAGKTVSAEPENKPAADPKQEGPAFPENTEEPENTVSEETGSKRVASDAKQGGLSAAALRPVGPEPLPDEAAVTCTLPLIRVGENAPAQLPVVPEKDGPDLPSQTDTLEKNVQLELSMAPQTDLSQELEAAQKPHEELAQATIAEEAEELVPAAKEKEEFSVAAQNISDKGRFAAKTKPSAAEKPVSENSDEQTVRAILNGRLTVPSGPEEVKEPLKTLSVEPELNQIKPRLNPTPEIKQFLNTQSEIIRRSRRKKANIMLVVLVLLLALGAVLGLQRLSADTQPAAADVPDPAPVSTPASAAEPGALETENLSVPVVPVPPPAPLSAGDKALAAVQNYQLAGNKGTIASYFDRLYQTRLSQGYKGEWSAEPLHKNTYIVKYRLTKPRVEPVVYVFQADAAQGKLTGALNNIALDLVGKI